MAENIHEYLARLRHEIEANGGYDHPCTQTMVKEEKRVLDLMARAMPMPTAAISAEEWERIKPLTNPQEVKP